jgi:hypothetical protein
MMTKKDSEHRWNEARNCYRLAGDEIRLAEQRRQRRNDLIGDLMNTDPQLDEAISRAPLVEDDQEALQGLNELLLARRARAIRVLSDVGLI